VPNCSMQHQNPVGDFDDTRMILQGASCTIAAGASQGASIVGPCVPGSRIYHAELPRSALLTSKAFFPNIYSFTRYISTNSVLAGFDRWPADARFVIEAALRRQPAQLSSSSIEGAETTSVEIYSPTHTLSLSLCATIRHTVASNPDIV
jgi:hypothetical protein